MNAVIYTANQREEDFLYDQLSRAGRKRRQLDRMESVRGSPEYYLAAREYDQAIEAARAHLHNLTLRRYRISALIVEMMKREGILP